MNEKRYFIVLVINIQCMKHQTRNTELNPYKLKLVASMSAACHGRHTADHRRTLHALYVVFGAALQSYRWAMLNYAGKAFEAGTGYKA